MTTIPSKAPAMDDGFTVEIDYCAGGSFAQVLLRNPAGERVLNRVLEPFDAMRLFEDLRRA
jgi:hypothetical protein